MKTEDDVSKIIQLINKTLNLELARLGSEYYYTSLPLCVIDAVFSLGIRYDTIQGIVRRYSQRFNLCLFRSNDVSTINQENLESFLSHYDELGLEAMTSNVFVNKNRTSSKNGILKSEAALRFAKVLHSYGVNAFEDIEGVINNSELERDIQQIPGQASGISLKYFWMLAGSDNVIKPDRMIRRFLERAVGRQVSTQEATNLLFAATHQLQTIYPHMAPRLLDHEIWKHQRVQ